MSDELEGVVPPFPLREAVRAGLTATDRAAFRATPFYRDHGAAFEEWTRAIRSGKGSGPPPSGSADRLRIVHWNIEQGKAWERLLRAIEETPQLRDADLWSLNEVDVGMARSGNRHVARALAERLGLHWVFIPNYLELTKGPQADALTLEPNEIGLHGSALLSRWPLDGAASADLTECFDYFHFREEKRYGRRRLLWATVRHPRGPFRFATAHLEVRNTPDCRDRQMADALAALPGGPCWLAGDWNTHTFRRGTLTRAVREFLRLQRVSSGTLARELVEPWEREPLLGRVEQAGFRVRDWNGRCATAREVLSGVEELRILPPPLRRWLTDRLALAGRVLRMRLDWIAVRGPWVPAPGGADPWTGTDLGPEGVAASDHAPIGVEAVWLAPGPNPTSPAIFR